MKELTNLQIGKRYTIVQHGIMGFVVKSHLKLIGVKVEPYAGHSETVRLIFKLKGKRSPGERRFCPRDPYIVWENWLPVNTDMIVETEERNGMTIGRSLPSCDPEYFERAKRSVSQQPLIEYRPN